MTDLDQLPDAMRHLEEDTLHRLEKIEAQIDREVAKLQQLRQQAKHTIPLLDSWEAPDHLTDWRDELLAR